MNVRTTSKLGLLSALSFVAFGTVSAPAFAESTEFRRGYEQGFQDARDGEKQQFGRYQQGPSQRIDIDQARYGVGRKTCDAEAALQHAVDRSRNSNTTRTSNNRYDDNRNHGYTRRNYSIVVSNQLCGDPAPNRTKELIVSYRCGNGDLTRVQTLEGNTLTMRC